MKKLIFSLIATIIGAALLWQIDKDMGYKAEIAQLRQELSHTQLYVPEQRDTIYVNGDSLSVVTSPVIEAKLRMLEQQHLVDQQLLKELNLKAKQLEAMQSTTTVTEDSAKADYLSEDSIFLHTDKWSRIEFHIKDTTFYYNIRDSLSTLVYREYKHRFLWWKWGTKGYKVSIVNHNPHSHVEFNRYLKVDK